MQNTLKGQTVLISGITDKASLALAIAKEAKNQGAVLVCTGLGKTPHHANLSEKGAAYLDRTYADFQATIKEELGAEVKTFPLDVTIDGSIEDFSDFCKKENISIHGFVHSIAMDKTIRGGVVKPMLDVTRDEFMDALNVSAYSLLAMTRSLLQKGVLANKASILALSYLGAEKIVIHPYKNIGVAKAALERIIFELSFELGKSHEIQVNAVRFSPYTASKAGGAIEGLVKAVEECNQLAPLGNAKPEDLAFECVYLLRKGNRITGEIRHVDGGYHIRG